MKKMMTAAVFGFGLVASSAGAGEVKLTDDQMDKVTAGVGSIQLIAPPESSSGSGQGVTKALPFKTSPSFQALINAASKSPVLN
jgi:hypothetical protein